MKTDPLWVSLRGRLKKHFVSADVARIFSAYEFADEIHKTTKPRVDDGKPYITHPVAVLIIILGWKIYDVETAILALLHDTIEESKNQTITFFQIVTKFGYPIAWQVLFLTKSELPLLRQLYLVGLRLYGTYRCLLVKFADTLHNMKTLEKMSDEQKKKKVESILKYFKGFKEKIEFLANLQFFDNPALSREQLVRANKIAYEDIMKETEKYLHLT